MRRYKRPHPENHSNQERWLLTYADMITLLTAFFLMLYSMSVMSKGKFSQLALSVRSGFSGITQGGGKLLPYGAAPNHPLGISEVQAGKYTAAMKNLDRYVEQHELREEVSTRSDERGVVISLVADKMLFERGKAELRGNSGPVLAHVAQILRAVPNTVAIEGHTCDLPIHTAQFPSNWELSTARAGTLLRYFTEQEKMPSRRFMAAGYADTRPLAPNTSEGNRGRNRRVDIVILKTDAQRQLEMVRQAEVRRITVNDAAPQTGVEPSSDGSPPSPGPENVPGGREGISPGAHFPIGIKTDPNDIHGRQGDVTAEP